MDTTTPQRTPVTFAIPEGTTPGACRSCKAIVFWIVTDRGKRMPVNSDGSPHFSTCPEAGEMVRSRTPLAFRDWLLELARSAERGKGAG